MLHQMGTYLVRTGGGEMRVKFTPVFEKHMHSKTGELVSSVEYCIMYVNDFPVSMIHSDFIWDASVENMPSGERQDTLWDRLSSGDTIDAELTLTPVEAK